MHLFVSFILKAMAVFIKDVVLYDAEETDNCQPSVSILHNPVSVLIYHCMSTMILYCIHSMTHSYLTESNAFPGESIT